MKRLVGPICAAAVMLTACQARAGESPFGWIYTADVHPQGTFEYEHKSFMQSGQSQGQYFFMQNKEEIEYGLTNQLQISGYFNWSYANAFRNGFDGTTGGPGVTQFLDASFDPYSRYEKTRFDSVSFEAIYQVLNPVTDPIGLALYIEPEIGPREKELATGSTIPNIPHSLPDPSSTTRRRNSGGRWPGVTNCRWSSPTTRIRRQW
ncbi:hypothetical protein [Bradyrhizobium zhanjiangense]|uniref:hypothetical protein n=1 Tax=Bradyrhizobium zhanjiangense TaxID=1325107 RepID=UPI0019D71A46|nr:hypothetical protein [Bradyrhizobium zhanjiangense]